MNNNDTCAIWNTPILGCPVKKEDGFLVNSPRAGGQYIIFDGFEPWISNCLEREKLLLTNWLVKQRQLGNPSPVITKEMILEVEQLNGTKISERVDFVLKYLEGKSERPGTRIVFYLSHGSYENVQVEDPHIVYLKLLAYSGCSGNDGLIYFMTELREAGLIKYQDKLGGSMQICTLTMEAHKRLAELEKTSTASSRVFVAMWFHDSMNDVWERGFKKAIEDAGYEPVRIDKQEHLNKIDDEIISEIRKARFVVADFTQGDKGARGGVYYEAGFAHGLGIPVIFTCHQKLLDDDEIHFDTRQYNHIGWADPADLRIALKNRITAVLGEGPKIENN